MPPAMSQMHMDVPHQENALHCHFQYFDSAIVLCMAVLGVCVSFELSRVKVLHI